MSRHPVHRVAVEADILRVAVEADILRVAVEAEIPRVTVRLLTPNAGGRCCELSLTELITTSPLLAPL